MTPEAFLSRLEGVRQLRPGRWVAKCPAHEDKSPSLSVSTKDDGTPMFHCFSGCSGDDLLSALGLSWKDIYPEREVEAGLTVVANLRKGRDAALIEWASQAGLAVRIDRKTPWGNPFAMPGESDRAAVCDRFARYLPTRPPLMGQVATLKGKVLLCWCHPAPCHGDHLAELANSQEGNP